MDFWPGSTLFAQVCLSECLGEMLYVMRSVLVHITKTRLFKYIENFTTKKGKFSDKNADIFHISAQNIDCGYSLEPHAEAVLTSTHNLVFEQK